MARRVFARVHRDWARSLDDFQALPAKLRRTLSPACGLPELAIVERRRAADGFVKYLFRLHDGAEIEAVRIPLPDPADARALKERRRHGEARGLVALPTAKYTLCISSQVGCALGCAFCATGRLGFARNLATWEMLAQVHAVVREADRPVRGVLFLGMGEPLLNYDNVMATARILSHPAGLAISADNISISTAGVLPGIRRLAAERPRFRLMISLVAPTRQMRLPLMPIERRWPLRDLAAAVRAYAAASRSRVTLAYVGISGLNVNRQAARDLARLFAEVRVKVNLIDVNDATGRYMPPTDAEVSEFRDELSAHHIPVVRRYAGGRDICAACGTLAATRQGGVVLGG
ncbi:MAG: radical SAM protein [Deltaproteobacteria bacterium]|nr:radical SAM protein [Deltaproteobacteria bacterium]